jgi:hypothetical protein
LLSLVTQELKNASNLAKDRSHLASSPATADFYPEFYSGSANDDTLIYQSYIRVPPTKPDSKHKEAYHLVAKQVSISKTKEEQQLISRIWCEFVRPLFDYPVYWILNELRDFGVKQKTSPIVRCK